jgi:sulfonate transport system permease protein
VLGLRRGGLIRHVILPNALVGLRYALGSAWLALVFAEQVNASQGIGYLMTNAEQFFQTDVIVRLAIRYLLAWRASFEGA